MDSSYMGYSAWSDMAKRVPPGKIGNITFPSFVSHVDLNWARPTGNVPCRAHPRALAGATCR
jgi:hypothetical protein